MLLAVVSDMIIVALVTGVSGVIIAGLNSAGLYLSAKIKVAVEKAEVASTSAAIEVLEVKQVLKENTTAVDGKLSDIAKTGEAIHILVNSNMAAQMKISAVALRRNAQLTNHPDDIAAADLAEKLLQAHEHRQGLVDGKFPGREQKGSDP
jgi:hypothetical protein